MKLSNYQMDLQLFLGTEQLLYVSIDILVSLLESKRDNTVLFVITHSFFKLTKTVPPHTVAAHIIAEILKQKLRFSI